MMNAKFMHSLEVMGVVLDAYSCLLCPILMKIVPEEITVEFTRQLKEEDVLSVKDLQKGSSKS